MSELQIWWLVFQNFSDFFSSSSVISVQSLTIYRDTSVFTNFPNRCCLSDLLEELGKPMGDCIYRDIGGGKDSLLIRVGPRRSGLNSIFCSWPWLGHIYSFWLFLVCKMGIILPKVDVKINSLMLVQCSDAMMIKGHRSSWVYLSHPQHLLAFPSAPVLTKPPQKY